MIAIRPWQADSKRFSLQELCIERAWKKVTHLHRFGLTFQICHYYRNVPAEFPDDLAANAAGRRQFLGIGNDGDMFYLAFTHRNGLPDRNALSTNSKAIACGF